MLILNQICHFEAGISTTGLIRKEDIYIILKAALLSGVKKRVQIIFLCSNFRLDFIESGATRKDLCKDSWLLFELSSWNCMHVNEPPLLLQWMNANSPLINHLHMKSLFAALCIRQRWKEQKRRSTVRLVNTRKQKSRQRRAFCLSGITNRAKTSESKHRGYGLYSELKTLAAVQRGGDEKLA